MIKLTLDDIQAHLRKNKFDAQIQQQTNQVYMIIKEGEKEFPAFFRIFNDELLQILVFIPCPMEKERRGDLGRLLHLLNRELDIPGFCMDERMGVVFYRCMIPVSDKKIPAKVFDNYIGAVETVCKSFTSAIEAVAYGAITVDDVFKRANEAAEAENQQ